MNKHSPFFIFSTTEETGFLWLKNNFITKNSLKSQIKWGNINDIKGWSKNQAILKQENHRLTSLNRRI